MKSKQLISTVFLTAVFSYSALAADTWTKLAATQTIEKLANNEVTVSIDYIKGQPQHSDGCYKCNTTISASQFWINVSSTALTDASKVRAVITNRRYHAYGELYPQIDFNAQSYVIDLSRQPEGHFAGDFSTAKKLFFNTLIVNYEAPLELYSFGYQGCFKYDQEIAVVIDGVWLNNMDINLYEQSFGRTSPYCSK